MSNLKIAQGKHNEGAFVDGFDFTFVLVEALKLNNKAITVDWREEPMPVLELLNNISKNTLTQCSQFEALKQRYYQSDYNITYFLETDTSEPSLISCPKDIG